MSENRAIARAAGLVAVWTFVSRIAGLLRDATIGYFFGTELAADAFFVAFRIPNLLRRFVAEGAMSTAFIPIFTDYWANRTRTEAIWAARVLATMLLLVVGTITLMGVLFAEPLTALFAPGFVLDPDKFALTVSLTRWTFPYIALVSLVALCSGILNSVRHFGAPAMSPVFLNLAMIAAAVASPLATPPVKALAYGVLAGGVLQLVLQMVPLWRLGIRLLPRWDPRHEAVGRAARLLLPTVFGAAVYQINLLVDTVLASALPAGSVSYLWYADRVFEFPLGIFAVALGTAALPSFSAQAARGELDDMRTSLRFAIRSTSFIVAPATVGLAALAVPITVVLFQRGAFAAEEAQQTARALAAFALGLWPVAVLRIVVPAFYALQDTRTPVWAAAIAFLANVGFSLSLMGPVPSGTSPLLQWLAWLTATLHIADFRHAGLALATSLAAAVNLSLMLIMLRRKLGPLGWRTLAPGCVRDFVAAVAMLPPVWWLQQSLDWTAAVPLWWRGGWLLVCVMAGAAFYTLTRFLLGGEEVAQVRQVLRKRYEQAWKAQA